MRGPFQCGSKLLLRLGRPVMPSQLLAQQLVGGLVHGRGTESVRHAVLDYSRATQRREPAFVAGAEGKKPFQLEVEYRQPRQVLLGPWPWVFLRLLLLKRRACRPEPCRVLAAGAQITAACSCKRLGEMVRGRGSGGRPIQTRLQAHADTGPRSSGKTGEGP